MHSQESLTRDLERLGVNSKGTLLVHSSMKAVGKVLGGAETVLRTLTEFMKEGLLVFPTHSWSETNNKNNMFDVRSEPSCVGLLTNLAMALPGAVRSLHPTHSVTAIGTDAESFVAGEENSVTPCPRGGCWGKLYDRNAQILFLGASLKTNTFIHGVEEWNRVPDRLRGEPRILTCVDSGGRTSERKIYGHYYRRGDVSHNYDKLKAPLLAKKIAVEGQIGDALSYLCSATPMADLVSEFLRKDPQLFGDDSPVPQKWYL